MADADQDYVVRRIVFGPTVRTIICQVKERETKKQKRMKGWMTNRSNFKAQRTRAGINWNDNGKEKGSEKLHDHWKQKESGEKRRDHWKQKESEKRRESDKVGIVFLATNCLILA